MNIAPQLLQAYPTLNDAQRAIISHEDGPLLVIAGPGSGKTLSLILRAMNILLLDKAQPSELILCTFTDKAAHEMSNRLMTLAKKVGYQGELSQVQTGTIHTICNQLITEYRHHTHLGNDYQVLDQFTQRLFIFQHLDEIARHGALDVFLNKWETLWLVARRLQEYFDKVMEELVDWRQLRADTRVFHRSLADAYNQYARLLMRENCISFSAQLHTAHRLLHNPEVNQKIIQKVRYMFVDEYQDTNYIQEQIITKLASATGNLCVVGDEDQALYRFRGATVRNILEFKDGVPNCTLKYLTTNYRSHQDIVHKYDRWMASADWTNAGKTPFRFKKTIEPDENTLHPDYPAIFCIQGKDIYDEAEQFADFVQYLANNGIVSDYSQIALLLYSVKPDYSGAYIYALEKRGIPYFCPRSRSFFEREVICLIVACFAMLFGYYGEKQGDLLKHEGFSVYIQKKCIAKLESDYDVSHPLRRLLEQLREEVFDNQEDTEDDKRYQSLTDYFYRFLAIEPFVSFIKDEQHMRNLVIFSKVLHTFQNFYHHTTITQDTLVAIRSDFFTIFLHLLEDGGLNEYEDTEQPLLEGHVQMMTIHQAKGLEFPVVVVGSLDAGHSGAQVIDRELGKYYQRGPFEPESRIPGFDMMRLYYVAFSRAENILVLTGNRHRPPQKNFYRMLDDLPQWPVVQDALLKMPQPEVGELPLRKHGYSFTSHVQMYETCPRQYQYFREYNFVPSRLREVFLGLLVHQTIEEIHRVALDGRFASLNKGEIWRKLDRVYECLSRTYPYPVDPSTKESAFTQVYNYFDQNRREIQQVIETEVAIKLEKDGYILTGRIDLLMKRNDTLEILDFKVDSRPKQDDSRLIDYERQLCTYADALERRYHLRPAKLMLYWTAEPHREKAIMEIHYRPEMIEQVNRSFSATVCKIEKKDFRIVTVPERHVCDRCDLQHLCLNEGIIKLPVCV
jgi:DNA helicase-2/ATP-dependent DNA helicase PcrA